MSEASRETLDALAELRRSAQQRLAVLDAIEEQAPKDDQVTLLDRLAEMTSFTRATLGAMLNLIDTALETTKRCEELEATAQKAVAVNAEALVALELANHTAQTAIGLVDPAMRRKVN